MLDDGPGSFVARFPAAAPLFLEGVFFFVGAEVSWELLVAGTDEINSFVAAAAAAATSPGVITPEVEGVSVVLVEFGAFGVVPVVGFLYVA